MKKIIKRDKKGFTLAELLIVVAIIAVLAAISIPIFNSQLEKSREGVDLANVRTAYAEVKSAALGGKGTYYKSVTGQQTTAGFKYVDISNLAEGLGTSEKAMLDKLATGVTIYITCTDAGVVDIVENEPSGAGVTEVE